MPDRHLLPIPLPHGRSGSTGFLTVYLSPRLKEAGVLGDYPEWARWAETVNSSTIRVEIDGVLHTPTRVGVTADPAIWEATFPDDLIVAPHRFVDWSSAPLQTVPTSDFSEAVLDLYAGVAARHPEQPPSGNTLVGLQEAAVLTARGGALDAAMSYVRPMDGDLIQEPRDPEWDFHAYVSLLGHHPQLLRHLGLALDLEVELPAAPATVLIRTDYQQRFGADGARLVTVMMNTTPDFHARPNTVQKLTEQEDGFLRLEEQSAFLSIMDVYSTATRLHRLDERVAERDGALPALTTRALTLVRPDLLTAFENRTTRQAEIEAEVKAELAGGLPVEVWAEDVAIGYQLDVLDVTDEKGAPWRSLFQRRADGEYRFLKDEDTLNLVPEPDEGWTETLLVTEIDEQLPPIVADRDEPIKPTALRRLDDQLYRWDGWSGAVRPPGRALDGTTGGVAAPSAKEPDVDDPVQFAVEYDVEPASLPRLRFGRTYQMRARCVDLAGDSRPLATPNPPVAATPAETFGRLEPIASPMVIRHVPRPVPGVGDDAATIVLLSDFHIDDATVAPQDRLLFPGRVGPDLCELHGEPKGGADPASYQVLADRDARAPSDQWTVDPGTGEPLAEGTDRQPVAYLADPFIERLRAFHHGEAAEHLVDVAGAWPDLSSARIEAVAGKGSTETNPTADTDLRFHVEKADIWDVDLSYAPQAGAVDLFGLWHRLSTTDQSALRNTIERGAHWMFTARRTVQLVHAVRRPLLAPRVLTWTDARGDDSTGITITATFEAERRSTGQLTMRARWTDLVDDLSLPGPVPRDGGAALGRFTTPRLIGTEFSVVEHRAELGDTKRHAATIDVEAFSSFSAYFTEEATLRLSARPVLVDRRRFAAGTVQVRFGEDGRRAEEGVDYTLQVAKGTITRTPRSRIPLGAELTVRFVPLPVSRTSSEHPSFEVIIPNTAVPPRPVIDAVLPAFSRSRRDTAGQHVVHDGRVARIYLERPWNVTGDGERLAVLVARTPGVTTSRLGRDPIVTAATALAPLAASALTSAVEVVTSEDGAHDLALHEVGYDPASGRWFADIAVATDAYRPFVQLVVARYQQDSISGRRLGPSVELEPLRLGVSRVVTAVAAGDGFDVTVTGREHEGIPTEEGGGTLAPNAVTVTVQEADPKIADADLRWMTSVRDVVLERSVGADGTTWSGHIAVDDGAAQRLLVEEAEPALFGGRGAELVDTVVYTEVIDLA